MARISGVDLPKEKRIEAALTYIFGIGFTSSRKILEKAGINPDTRVNKLSDTEVAQIRAVIDASYKVEGELKTEIAMNIKRLKDIQSYRGFRHIKKLPVRGQRTHTNARAHKGPRPSVGGKKRTPAATGTKK